MKNNLIKFILLIIALILFTSGILIGLTINKDCSSNPLTYGIKKVEKLNDANFSCACYSTDKALNIFYFDDKGIYQEDPFN